MIILARPELQSENEAVPTARPLSSCPYGGRENARALSRCSECGTVLVPQAIPERKQRGQKSEFLAIVLALGFGPLGLLYVGLEGLGAMCVVVGVTFVALPLIIQIQHFFFFSMLVRIRCAAWAVRAIQRRKQPQRVSPQETGAINDLNLPR